MKDETFRITIYNENMPKDGDSMLLEEDIEQAIHEMLRERGITGSDVIVIEMFD